MVGVRTLIAGGSKLSEVRRLLDQLTQLAFEPVKPGLAPLSHDPRGVVFKDLRGYGDWGGALFAVKVGSGGCPGELVRAVVSRIVVRGAERNHVVQFDLVPSNPVLPQHSRSRVLGVVASYLRRSILSGRRSPGSSGHASVPMDKNARLRSILMDMVVSVELDVAAGEAGTTGPERRAACVTAGTGGRDAQGGP